MNEPATPDAGPRRSGPSLQRRVGRFTLLIVALAVLFTGAGAFVATRAAVTSTVDRVLFSVSSAARRAVGPAPDRRTLEGYVLDNSSSGYVVMVLIESDGFVFRPPGSDTLPVDARDFAVAAGTSGSMTRMVTSEGGASYRVRVFRVGQQPGAALLVGRPMAAAQEILASLALALLTMGVLAVVAAGLVGRRVARAGVAPVRALTGEVEQRAAEDDLTPVVIRRDDEIGRLTAAFNNLLETVHVSRVRQSRFVADAGHELRTPLTSMRTNIELLAVDADQPMLRPGDRMTIMRDVQAQLVGFSGIVSDLIGLTREDRNYADYEVIDLTAVLEEAVDRVSMRAPGLHWAVHLDTVELQGDADLLARAFVNVLDNAVKYSPPGGTISVTLQGGEVRIGDEGRGVDPAERPFVFDRFYRSEASRATPGTGLGLSITDSVVRQHRGTVAVLDAPGGGALFVLTFPTATIRSVSSLS